MRNVIFGVKIQIDLPKILKKETKIVVGTRLWTKIEIKWPKCENYTK